MRKLIGISSSCALVALAQPATSRSFVLTKALSPSCAAAALAAATWVRFRARGKVSVKGEVSVRGKVRVSVRVGIWYRVGYWLGLGFDLGLEVGTRVSYP